MFVPRSLFVIGLGSVFAAASAASGTVLIFDPVPATDSTVLQAYGDRVQAASQFGFQYGLDGGITPNVVVIYQPTLRYRNTGYGDLQNFLYREDSGDRAIEIRIAADTGFQVCLHHFDLAAQLGESLRAQSVQVLDGPGNVLFRQDSVLIPGEENNPTHLRFEFSPLLCAEIIRVRIELANLTFKSDQIAIDNIQFGQIPEPASAALAALGGVVALRRRRPRV